MAATGPSAINGHADFRFNTSKGLRLSTLMQWIKTEGTSSSPGPDVQTLFVDDLDGQPEAEGHVLSPVPSWTDTE